MSKTSPKIRLSRKSVRLAKPTPAAFGTPPAPLRITRQKNGKYAVIDTTREASKRIISEHDTEGQAERAARGEPT